LAELESPEHDMLKIHLRQEIVPLSRIVEIVDDKGFNLLHHAVLKGVPGKVDVLIDLFNSGIYEQNISYADKMKSDWVNSRTDGDRFTPLHFASFKGNINAIEALVKQGSDPHISN